MKLGDLISQFSALEGEHENFAIADDVAISTNEAFRDKAVDHGWIYFARRRKFAINFQNKRLRF